jgi:D-xylose transport system permease protein
MSRQDALPTRPTGATNLTGQDRLLAKFGRFRGLIEPRALSMLVVFAVLAIVFHVASDGIFFTPRNLSLLLRQASIVAIVAAGVSILMVMGEIDLSIGSAVYLCSVVAATLQVSFGMPVLPTLLLTVAAGMLMGAWNGFWVVRVAVPSFVVTLAGLLAFRGIGYYATDAATIAPMSASFSALSEAFVPPVLSAVIIVLALMATLAFLVRRHHGRGELHREDRLTLAILVAAASVAAAVLLWVFLGFRGIPAALLWVVAGGVILWVLMSRTPFGRNAYVVGANREAAELAGISLGRQLFWGFVLMGVMYGIAGTLLTARLSASTPTAGSYLELDAIAAAVIGGTSLRGGVGTIPGAIIGAVLLALIDNGMSILNISSFIQLVVKGMVLLIAIAFDAYMIRHRTYRV